MKHFKRQLYRAGCLAILLGIPTGSLMLQATPAKADLACIPYIDPPTCKVDGKIGKWGQTLLPTIAGTVCTLFGTPAAGAACVAGAKGVIILNNSSQGNSAGGQTGQPGTGQAATSVDVTTTEWRAREAIEKLKQAGKTKEAQILANSLVKKTELEQRGETQRAQIYTDALERMTNAQTEADLEKAQLSLEGIKDTNQTTLEGIKNTNQTALGIEGIRAKVANGQQLTAVEIEKIRAETAKGLQLSQVETAKINANAQKLTGVVGTVGSILTAVINKPQNPSNNNQSTTTAPTESKTVTPLPPTTIATAPSDPTASLLTQWGWTKVPCAVGAVFIKGLSADTVCINPTGTLAAGEYIFDSATNQLQPVAVNLPASIPSVVEQVVDPDEDIEDTADAVDESFEDAENEELESEDFEEDL